MARKYAGTIRKLPSGRYQVRVIDPMTKQRTSLGTFKLKKDAEAALISALGEVASGSFIAPKAGSVTFGAIAQDWLDTRLVRPGTLARDASYLRARILPTFGAIPVGRITHADARRWVAQLSREVSPATVRKATQLARAIAQQAVKDKLVPTNPFDDLDLPALPASTRRALDDDELTRLVQAMPDRWRALVALLGTLGLRPGEALALTPADVDLLHRQLHVTKTASRPNGRLLVGEPKTRAGRRSLPLSDALCALLEAHMATYAVEGVLFPTVTGKVLRLNEWRTTVWRPALRAAGIEDHFPIHALRHTALTAWVRAGVDIPTATARAGHSTARVLLDVYAKANQQRTSADDQLDRRAEAILLGHDEGTTTSIDEYRTRLTRANS